MVVFFLKGLVCGNMRSNLDHHHQKHLDFMAVITTWEISTSSHQEALEFQMGLLQRLKSTMSRNRPCCLHGLPVWRAMLGVIEKRERGPEGWAMAHQLPG